MLQLYKAGHSKIQKCKANTVTLTLFMIGKERGLKEWVRGTGLLILW
jgi:hypothetical protein